MQKSTLQCKSKTSNANCLLIVGVFPRSCIGAEKIDGIKLFGEMIHLFLSKKARFQFNQRSQNSRFKFQETSSSEWKSISKILKRGQTRGVCFNFRKFLPGIQQSEISSRESGPLWTSHPINHCTLKSKMASMLLQTMVAFKDISEILLTSLSSRHFITRQSYAFRLIIKNEDLAKHLCISQLKLRPPDPRDLAGNLTLA